MPRTSQLNPGDRLNGKPKERLWKIDVDSFGLALTKVITGDMDGSGEAPGVQLEFEHVGTPQGGVALAMSGREAELVARALTQAAATIRPSERLRVATRKWNREVICEQPAPPPEPIETVRIESQRQLDVLMDMIEEAHPERRAILKSIMEQLEIPF